jgi:hypothetical protein
MNNQNKAQRLLAASYVASANRILPKLNPNFFVGMLAVIGFSFSALDLRAEVPAGNSRSATNYYRQFAITIGFSKPDTIFQTTLDDVATYMGYGGFTGADLQNLPPESVMNPRQFLSDSNASAKGLFQHSDTIAAGIGTNSIQPDEMDSLLTLARPRFFIHPLAPILSHFLSRKTFLEAF